jgi:L-arabinokinase
MGGIADYSGATVLELPLALSVTVAAQRSDDGLLTAYTTGPEAPPMAKSEVSVPLDVLLEGPRAAAPERMRAALVAAEGTWAAYILGPLATLYAAGLLHTLTGLRLAVWSGVFAGAGISSSAALEVASLRAITNLLSIEVEPLLLATLAQQAEHRVALAPCGIMDQVTAVLGRRDHLLVLKCQPATVLGHRGLPRDARLFGIDSAIAHRVGGAQYGRVRTATFMGRTIIENVFSGLPPGGYLCNLPLVDFLERYVKVLPETLDGASFLGTYGSHGDTATHVEPDILYRVRDCTSHPVYEQAHVERFLAALDQYEDTGDRSALEDAGKAMYRSHESYSQRCGLGTPQTDLLVELVREAGSAKGLFGAKITGGGSGGTVAVLGAGPRAHQVVEAIAASYLRRTGNAARVIAGSGAGALDLPPWHAITDEHGAVHAH